MLTKQIFLLKNKCLACNEINHLKYFNEERKILECVKCNAIFSEEPINSKDAHKTKDTHVPSFSEKIKNKFTHEYFWKILADEYWDYLKDKTDMNFKTALDVGTYFGSLVSKMNKNGIDAWGIESNQNAVNLSGSKKVEYGYFDENYKSKTNFDLICLTQMIYYMRDNYSLLNHVKSMLNKDGLIFIAAANPESSYFRNQLKSVIGGPGTNMILSKTNFESMEEKNGLKLLDYTSFRTNMFIDLYTSKHKKLDMMKYFLKLKKAYQKDPDGSHVFLLLKLI